MVQASQIVPFDVKLELAKTSATIEVTAELPLVQTATSDLGFQVDSSTIQHAALVDRDVFGVLPFLAPQVSPGLDMSPTSGGQREASTSYLLNGAEDNNNFSSGAINIDPPLESIEDFAIITNSMGAQYGRGAGAVVSANQKTGTNKFHGVAYEQNRNATLNSNDFFYNRQAGNAGTKPKYIKNQFGGAVGGPIKKDKTFFFFAYDRFKLLQGVTAADQFAPTTAALSFIKANGGPLAQKVLAAYPPLTSDAACPNLPGTGAGFSVGCLSFTDPQTTTTNSYYGRVDQNFSDSDRLSFAVNIGRRLFVDKFGGGGLLSNGNIPFTNTVNNQNFSLIETHTFSSRVANELNFSQTRYANPQIEGDPATQTVPNIFIDNQNEGCLSYQLGPFEGGQIIAFTEDRWTLQDNLTLTVGRHALKIGGSANYGILYRNWDLGKPGQYEFGELTSISAGGNSACPTGTVISPSCDLGSNKKPTLQADGTIAHIIPGTEPNTSLAGDYPYFQETSINPATGAIANAYRHYTTHDYAAFVQDDWRVTARLTLNLGVRWERFGAPSEDHGIIAQFANLNCNILDPKCISAARVGPTSRMWNTRNGDVGPRIGFAWDPFGKGTTAIRGGYGIYYDRIFDNIWSNGAWNPPFYALLDFSANSTDSIFFSNPASIGAGYNPNGPCGQIPYAPGAPATCPAGTPGKRVSVRTMDVNLHDTSGQNFYLGVEHQFFGGLLLRASYQGSLGRHEPMLENYNRVDGIGYNSSLTAIRPNPLYTGFNYRSNSVSSNYNSLVLEAQKHMGHGLEFQMGYTHSKLLDVNSDLFAGCSAIGGLTAPYYYISNALPRLSYGRGADDHANAYKFNVTYELPFLKAEKGFVGHALGGWSLGSFLQFYSGHPVDVYDGRAPYAARDASGNKILDANGIPINIGGDYNLDGVRNDHPVFVGSNLNAIYTGKNPADGMFNGGVIGCGASWLPASVANVAACNKRFGATTPNPFFVTPGYPSSGALFDRFGTLGRDVFVGPQFVDMDFGLHKTFNLTETMNLRFSAEAQNLFNHPNFDGVQGNLASSRFGQAELLVGSAQSRVMSLSLRLAF